MADVGRSFFELRSRSPLPSMIPYHRVLRIELDGDVLWDRADPRTSGPRDLM